MVVDTIPYVKARSLLSCGMWCRKTKGEMQIDRLPASIATLCKMRIPGSKRIRFRVKTRAATLMAQLTACHFVRCSIEIESKVGNNAGNKLYLVLEVASRTRVGSAYVTGSLGSCDST